MTSIIHKNRLLEVVIWLVLLVLLLSSAVISETEPDHDPKDLFESMSVIGLLWVTILMASYTALYLHTRLFQQRRYAGFAAGLLISLLGLVAFFRTTVEILIEASFVQSFFADMVSFSLVAGIAIGMRYAKQGVLDRYLLKEIQTQLLKAELGALKSQINPHFLFNTLNNIYGVNLKDSEKGSEMILSLSEMFRYFLEAQKRDKVTLSEELELLGNYIALERMRLTPANRIDLTIVVANPNLVIPPLLLMPLVENAVKYGVHPTKETDVLIDITQDEHELTLITLNDVHAHHRIPSTRTGLKNLKERLDRLYPNRYTLLSEGKDGRWRAKLVIPL